jgi:hypothetical protein
MFDKDKVWHSEKSFKTITGLEILEAKLLLEDFEEILYRKRHQKSKAGRPSKLRSKDIFLMTLAYIRQYDTLEFLGVIFDLDASNVKRWIDDSYDVLEEILAKKNFSHLTPLILERI